jgi:hypothetical protein
MLLKRESYKRYAAVASPQALQQLPLTLMYVPPSSTKSVATKVGALDSDISCDLRVVRRALEAEMDLVRATFGGVVRRVEVIVDIKSTIGGDDGVDLRV